MTSAAYEPPQRRALSASEHSAQLRQAVIASTIGTTIEWYDFFIYGTAAGLIFGKLYFPNEDPLTATLAAFGTYFIGFASRPVGAAIFGHYGDRIGRKGTLIATLLLMGIATFLIAFVPTYASIGIWGAVILTVLRMIQGIGVGGEWGGSVLLAMEWSRHHGQRGLVASWPQFGVPAGLFLANLSILAFSALSGDQFATWGWRIPFALSIVLIGIGLWIRIGILETPVFQQLLDQDKIEKAPIIEVFRKQPKEIILSALLRMGQQAPFYIFTAFIFAYAVGTLHMPESDLERSAGRVLRFVCQHSTVRAPLRPDRAQKDVPDRRCGARLVRFLYFGMVDTAIPSAVFIAIVVSLIPHDMQYGPQAAPHGATGTVLHFYRLHLCICRGHPTHAAEPDFERSAGRVLRFVCQHSTVRAHLRPDRAQKDVPDRRCGARLVRIPVFRHGGYRNPLGGVHRDRPVIDPA